jgi:hypothetical protein
MFFKTEATAPNSDRVEESTSPTVLPFQAPGEIYAYVERLGHNASSWYRAKKQPKQRLSILLRCLSLFLLLAGGLSPLIPPGTYAVNGQAYGYLLLAAGGGLQLFDHLFGVSSAWMRYIVAAQEIEACLDRFRLEWYRARGADATTVQPVQSTELVSIASDAVLRINEIVRRETDEWRAEFRTNLVYLSRLSNHDRSPEAGKTASR